MVTDAGRAAMCRRKFKASSLQAESTKNGRPLENMGFDSNRRKISDGKKEQKQNARLFQKNTQWNTRPLRTIIEYGPCNQEEVKRIKIGKSVQIGTVGTLQD